MYTIIIIAFFTLKYIVWVVKIKYNTHNTLNYIILALLCRSSEFRHHNILMSFFLDLLKKKVCINNKKYLI